MRHWGLLSAPSAVVAVAVLAVAVAVAVSCLYHFQFEISNYERFSAVVAQPKFEVLMIIIIVCLLSPSVNKFVCAASFTHRAMLRAANFK